MTRDELVRANWERMHYYVSMCNEQPRRVRAVDQRAVSESEEAMNYAFEHEDLGIPCNEPRPKVSTKSIRCVCSDPGCKGHAHGSSECGRRATSMLCRIDMASDVSSDVYDMPMCQECAEDALESGVFDAQEIRGDQS